MKIKTDKLPAFLTMAAIISMLSACVPARQFEDAKKRETDCREENTKLKDENQRLSVENTELKSSSSEMQKNLLSLQRDTTEMGRGYQRLNTYYTSLSAAHDKLQGDYDKLLAGNSEDTKRLVLQLDQTRTDLKAKEDQLRRDSTALNEREKQIHAEQARVEELEAILRKNDSTMNKLKSVVSNALMGYENKGLTVYQKAGKVYVSMEEQLLFASGSTDVEKSGENAIKDLAKVLASNKDINIQVEGHTDNVPINGVLPSGAKDNWELSVLRATSVVKIILADKSIDPVRITATGKGPFEPVDPANTAEARKKNRRTEIILSPKLDEIAKVMKTE
jgi:chemotaxis protein MotB